METIANKGTGGRNDGIDQFRGFAILSMVLVDYLALVRIVPAWLKHSPDVGLTVADLIAPWFIFAIGLTYGPAFRRRMASGGWQQTAAHFLRRFLVFIGIGAILSAGEIAFQVNGTSTTDWGVLQAIGVAGLITLPLLVLSKGWRALAGLGLLAVYQVLLDRFWLGTVLASPHGGLYGSLGWASMMILATVLADFYNERGRRNWYTVASLLTLAIGILLSFWFPISKNRVSASYVLICLGCSALLFLAFDLLNNRARIRLPLLTEWGENPITLYLLHFAVLGIFYLPGIPGLYEMAPWWLVILEAAAMVSIISGFAVYLHRRRWIIKF